MGETEVIVNSANDLLLLGDAIRNVPLRQIARVSLKGFRRQESDLELYELLFTNIIHLFDPSEFEAEVSCVVLPELVSFIEKIQAELQSNALAFFFVENLTILLRLANVLLKLVEYLTTHAERCPLYRSLAIFPEYLLRCYTIVRRNYVTMAGESEVLETMKALYAICKRMLTAFLELLCPREASSRGSYFRSMDQDEDFDCMTKVCTLLGNMSNEISPIDSLLASDVWKTIVKLCAEHAEQCFTRNKAHWLGETVLILNSSIEGSFSDVRMKNESSKQCTIALKLNAFFLRVMLKLVMIAKQRIEVDVFGPILRTLLEIKSCLRAGAICADVATSIEQYLHIGYMAIVESSFRTENFAKALFQYDCKSSEEIHSLYYLLMHVIAQTVANANESELITLYCCQHNLLKHVCSLLKCSDSLFCHDATLYKKLLVHCSALVLNGVRTKNRTVQKTIEETLVRMVLQEHYHTGVLGIDIWSVFVRFHSTQLMYAYFIFWKKINDQYSCFNTRPAQVYVAQLLRNLFLFLPAAQQEKILETHPTSNRANDRLWATLSPLPGDINESRKKHFSTCLEKRIVVGINDLQQSPGNIGAFYETLTCLSITDVGTSTFERFWNSQVNWDAILKTPSASCIFGCFEQRSAFVPHGTIFTPSNASSIAEASPYVKLLLIKMLRRTKTFSNVSIPLEALLVDSSPFVSAHAYDLLRNLKENQLPIANELLSKQPTLLSKLALLQKGPTTMKISSNEAVSVRHQCHRESQTEVSESCGDLTLLINNEIDELLSDDDDDIHCISTEMFVDDQTTQTKKRRFNASSEQRNGAEISECLNVLQVQANRLKCYVQTKGSLPGSQNEQLRSIISTLTKLSDS